MAPYQKRVMPVVEVTFSGTHAEVMELVDNGVLETSVCSGRVGSSPTFCIGELPNNLI